jgi:hypothetical protein
MSERHLIRTAEAMCDDLDARLARMTPRHEAPTKREYWEGARDTAIFVAIIGGAVWLLLSAGGV